MKTSLLTFLNAVWATYDTVQNLKYGDADMISDNDAILAKFEVILGRLDRQIQMSENVMQVIATGINVIQAEVSNKLATLIVWLTVAGTAVLVPNTLATIFGLFPNTAENLHWMLAVISLSTLLSVFVTYKYTKRWKVKSFGMRKLRRIKKKLRYN